MPLCSISVGVFLLFFYSLALMRIFNHCYVDARGHIVTVSECSAGLAPGGYSNS